MNEYLLLRVFTGIIATIVLAVFFSLAWSVLAPHDSKLRRKLCRLMHGRELNMYAGGANGECWCGLKWPAPWRPSGD